MSVATADLEPLEVGHTTWITRETEKLVSVKQRSVVDDYVEKALHQKFQITYEPLLPHFYLLISCVRL